MKKKVVIIFLFLILLLQIRIIKNINSNDIYYNNQIKELKKHFPIKDKILNLNYNDYHYIITLSKSIIVLDDNYQKVYQEKRESLAQTNNKSVLIYKNNKLVYRTTKRVKNKLKYTYYNAHTNEIINEINLRK